MRILIFISLVFVTNTYGKDIEYPASKIPEVLTKKTNVVVREAHTDFTIVAKNEARQKVRRVLTILNEFGKESAIAYVHYDKLTKVLNFEGALYNANGELVRKLKKSDIYDRSAVAGYSLYEDSRVQIANLQYGQYPYTVEFEFEVKYKYLFQIPSFHLLTMQKMSVQEGVFSLVFPTSLAPRFKAMNTAQLPEETVDEVKGTKTLVWRFKNYEAIQPEPFGLSFDELVPKIMVAPSDFEYEGYAGNMETWDNFGRWVNSLNNGRGVLDAQAQLTAKQLTEDLGTTEEKVKKLYEYLQSKTRYVNISLGIGGFQPFEASVVEKTGYGDCKALSNYMVALLGSVGIKGYYSLIMAGENFTPLQTDFPSSQFNHVVVAVPNGSDTLWLECTSQTQPFGYLGTFTDDRYALMILDDGATLVKTASYGSNTNIQARTAEVYVNEKGEATANVSTSYSGLQYENGDLNFILSREDELKKWVNNHTDIPAFDLKRVSARNDKSRIPTAKLDIELSIPRLAVVNGKRIFLTPNLMNRSSFIPETNESRKSEIVIKTGWTDFDTIRYYLPEQIYHEFLPEPVHIESAFGVYDAEYTMESGLLVYKRRLLIREGRFSGDSYPELCQFYQNIKKADETKVVLLDKT